MRHVCTADWDAGDEAKDCEGAYPQINTTVTSDRDPFWAREVGEATSIRVQCGTTGIVRGYVREWHAVHVELDPDHHVWIDPEYLTWTSNLNPTEGETA